MNKAGSTHRMHLQYTKRTSLSRMQPLMMIPLHPF